MESKVSQSQAASIDAHERPAEHRHRTFMVEIWGMGVDGLSQRAGTQAGTELRWCETHIFEILPQEGEAP